MEYESLDGVKGRSVLVNDYSRSTAIGTAINILPANPRRVWAIVQAGTELTVDILVYLRPKAVGLTALTLSPGGHVLFNKDFPFTGGISVSDYPGAGGVTVRCLEAEVQE